MTEMCRSYLEYGRTETVGELTGAVEHREDLQDSFQCISTTHGLFLV